MGSRWGHGGVTVGSAAFITRSSEREGGSEVNKIINSLSEFPAALLCLSASLPEAAAAEVNRGLPWRWTNRLIPLPDPQKRVFQV